MFSIFLFCSLFHKHVFFAFNVLIDPAISIAFDSGVGGGGGGGGWGVGGGCLFAALFVITVTDIQIWQSFTLQPTTRICECLRHLRGNFEHKSSKCQRI